MTVKLQTEHHLVFLRLTGGCTDSSESTIVKMPHFWKSHVAAQLYYGNRPTYDNFDIITSVCIQCTDKTAHCNCLVECYFSLTQRMEILLGSYQTLDLHWICQPGRLKYQSIDKVLPVLSGHSKMTKTWLSRPIIA